MFDGFYKFIAEVGGMTLSVSEAGELYQDEQSDHDIIGPWIPAHEWNPGDDFVIHNSKYELEDITLGRKYTIRSVRSSSDVDVICFNDNSGCKREWLADLIDIAPWIPPVEPQPTPGEWVAHTGNAPIIGANDPIDILTAHGIIRMSAISVDWGQVLAYLIVEPPKPRESTFAERNGQWVEVSPDVSDAVLFREVTSDDT